MEHQISIKQILVDLIGIIPQINNEFGSNEKYAQLLTFLNAKDYFNDDDLAYPTLKQIEEETGIKTYHLRKQLKEIYDKLFDYDYDFNFDFSQTKLIINVEYFKRYASFNCKPLKYLPKIGENITLHFLRAKVGTDYFYVQDIRHSFIENKQIIDLYLKSGYYNSYWYYRKHKALEEGEIGIGEQYDLYEYQMKERLGLRW
ncbi:hypothetical protein [Xanthomarina gelatinilytica]|uniref:hypothetical protein n=1 Tax=Xanthomarina gelatinilytica TaxID=1137281 RepID=UPI003AA9C63E